jgi:hypothetical protein
VPVQAFKPRLATTEEAAVEEAKAHLHHQAGVLVLRRIGNPVVDEEGDPEIIFRTGTTAISTDEAHHELSHRDPYSHAP